MRMGRDWSGSKGRLKGKKIGLNLERVARTRRKKFLSALEKLVKGAKKLHRDLYSQPV